MVRGKKGSSSVARSSASATKKTSGAKNASKAGGGPRKAKAAAPPASRNVRPTETKGGRSATNKSTRGRGSSSTSGTNKVTGGARGRGKKTATVSRPKQGNSSAIITGHVPEPRSADPGAQPGRVVHGGMEIRTYKQGKKVTSFMRPLSGKG